MSRRLSNGIFMCTDQAGPTSPTTACTRLGALQTAPSYGAAPLQAWAFGIAQQSAPKAAGTCPRSVSPGQAQSRHQAWPEAGGTA